MDPMYGDLSAFLKKKEKVAKRISPKQYKKERHKRIIGRMHENFPFSKKYK
jgi:hypothetical protein